MPSITVPALYECFINIVISSPRPEGLPAHIIANGAMHDEIASQVRAAMREYRHLGENEEWVASALQVQTYLPATGSNKFYAVRALMPAGSIVEVNEDYFLDVLRIRYSMVFAILPGSLQADPRTGEAHERHWQAAFKSMLVTGNSLQNVFIPGDEDRRPGDRTEIDLTLEMGPSQGRLRYDLAPS